MIKKVKQYMREHRMLQQSDKVIVGVSGGPDSICLLCILHSLKETLGIELVAVHVHHGLRGAEADADEQFVIHFCKERNVTLEVMHEDVALYATERGLSTEEAGRVLRRKAFENAMKKYGGTKIALAHHMNDNAETMLFHAARGTGLRGIAGISPVRGVYIRPLLCVTREEIEMYLQKEKIKACLDQTNLHDDYTRNRIRNHVIPYMKEYINPRTVEHLHTLAKQMESLRDFIDREVVRCWDQVVTCRGGIYEIDGTELMKLDEALRPYLLQKVVARAAGREQDIEAVHLKDLQKLVKKQSGKSIDLPFGLCAKKQYDKIVIVKTKKNIDKDSAKIDRSRYESDMQINVKKTEDDHKLVAQKATEHLICDRNMVIGQEKTVYIDQFHIKIKLKLFQNNKNRESFEELPYTKWFDYDIIQNSAILRTRRGGDVLTIDTEGHTQKLKKYFVNAKVPQDKRDQTPLLVDGAEIMWVIGYRQSKKYQVTTTTKRILEVSVEVYEGGKDGREY